MKQRIKIYLLFTLTIAFLYSCSSDECTADDYVGTWSGDGECSDETMQTNTLIITAVDANTIRVDDQETEPFNVSVSGCSFTESVSLVTFLGPLEAQYVGKLNGNNLELDVAATIIGITTDCNLRLERQ